MSDNLPRGWENTVLGELGSWSSGGTPFRKYSSYYGGDIPWVKTGDLKNKILTTVPEAITSEGLKNSSAKIFPKGSLLVAMYGATIGRTAILGVPASTNQACAALLAKGRTPSVIPYVWKYIQSVQEDLKSAGKGGAQPNISQGVLKEFPIPLPPLKEQKRIVKKIDSLMECSGRAKEALDDVPALLEQYRQSVLAAAFRGDLTKDWREENLDVEPASILLERIRSQRRQRWEETELAKLRAKGKEPKNDKWKAKYTSRKKAVRSDKAEERSAQIELGDLPNSWRRCKLRDVMSLQAGYAFKSSWFNREEGVRLLRGANIFPGKTRWDDAVFLTDEEAKNYSDFSLSDGDLLIAMDRPFVSAGIKICRVRKEDLPALLVQRVGRFLAEDDICTDYLEAFITSGLFKEFISGQETGGDIPHISGNDVEASPIPLPPLAEQKEISRVVQNVFEIIETVEQSYQSAKEQCDVLNQSIFAKAFRGELVPQDPTDEPASILLERIQIELAAAPKDKRMREKKSIAHNNMSKRKAVMSKSRQDEDVLHKPYLAGILKEVGATANAEELFGLSSLLVVDFYKQLAWEVDNGHIRDDDKILAVA